MPRHLPLALLLLLAPLSARAEAKGFFGVGPLVSVGAQDQAISAGLGVEMSQYRVQRHHALGFFQQAQVMNDGHFRLTGGLQATYVILGLEAGATYETGTKAYLPTAGLHLAPHVSFFGYGAIGVRVSVPLTRRPEGDSDAASRGPRGYEVGVVLTRKFPFEL
ncbi:hypothetical protein LZ198_15410 [Myxococcus sp. K15C18031901]|uniref:hypothetical protein n=1 Tax=Myxococcus dinghuensis TaxID=2906761 RepID=UPI0020A7184B|nr:hypothetical protein [Myxococcus dinghuensis]MCP3100257.1 hypothetical protein [Myxococcus dinghuensis]